MDIAALIAWVLAAGGGFVMLGIWLSRRNRPEAGRSRFPASLIFGHFGLAALGLVLWLVYVFAVDTAALNWIAVGILVVVALLGFTMFARWLRGRQAGEADAPEQHFPVLVVGGHGLLAVVTVVLVLLSALGVAGG